MLLQLIAGLDSAPMLADSPRIQEARRFSIQELRTILDAIFAIYASFQAPICCYMSSYFQQWITRLNGAPLVRTSLYWGYRRVEKRRTWSSRLLPYHQPGSCLMVPPSRVVMGNKWSGL